jgi:hypothetical protein
MQPTHKTRIWRLSFHFLMNRKIAMSKGREATFSVEHLEACAYYAAAREKGLNP